MTDRYRQLHDLLARMGGTHSLEDILIGIGDGHFQSWAKDESWAVTQILEMPQKKVLEIFLTIGSRADMDVLYDKVMAFAREQNCDLVRAFGRDGWLPDAERHGWRNGVRVFIKEL